MATKAKKDFNNSEFTGLGAWWVPGFYFEPIHIHSFSWVSDDAVSNFSPAGKVG